MRALLSLPPSYVLPTTALVAWLCDQFEGCSRVVSLGAGSAFLEVRSPAAPRARA